MINKIETVISISIFHSIFYIIMVSDFLTKNFLKYNITIHKQYAVARISC